MQYLPLTTAAEELGVSSRYLYKAIRAGIGPNRIMLWSAKVGKRRITTAQAIEDFVQALADAERHPAPIAPQRIMRKRQLRQTEEDKAFLRARGLME